jgi:hypothetical protein
MMGAGVRFGAGAYAKNAASLGADNGFMHQYADTVGGKSVKRYATSLQANSEPGVNPFSWDNFFGA